MYPSKEIDMIPVGHIMNAFEKMAVAGTLPVSGYTSVFGLYKDQIHLNKEGVYIQLLAGYAVIFKNIHDNAGLSYNEWWGTDAVTAQFASFAADLVWQVVQRCPISPVWALPESTDPSPEGKNRL